MSHPTGEWHYHTESTHLCPILKESGMALSYRKQSFMSNAKGELFIWFVMNIQQIIVLEEFHPSPRPPKKKKKKEKKKSIRHHMTRSKLTDIDKLLTKENQANIISMKAKQAVIKTQRKKQIMQNREGLITGKYSFTCCRHYHCGCDNRFCCSGSLG